jgi:hypothetical protein
MSEKNEFSVVVPARLESIPYEAGEQRFQPVAQYQGNLAEFDYVEKEVFATGIDEDGKEYKTLLIVRMPRDPKKFSGTIVSESFHFYPITPIFSHMSMHIMRNGHAWIAIGSQKTNLELCVKPVNPARYAPLHIGSDPLSEAASKLNFLVVAAYPNDEGNFWWQELNKRNKNANAILSQVGAAVKLGAGPFECYQVKHIIFGGHSYTGYLTTRYIRSTHNQIRLADGAPIYDGFFPSGWPTTAFDGYDVPIVQCVTEADICTNNELPYRYLYAGLEYRRPDSDSANDRYRLYEFPGFGHTSTQFPPTNDIKFLEQMDPSLSVPNGAISSSQPYCELHSMALHHLIRWVSDGTVPPKAERMALDESDDKAIFRKDAHGNTIGGVRCVQMDVPRAKHLSNIIAKDGTVRFGGYGLEAPFGTVRLKQLYGNRENYLKQFKARMERLLKDGWLLDEDVPAMLQDAERVELN